jgi:hypothetical protein
MDDIKRDANGKFAKGKKGGPGRPKLGYVLADVFREKLNEPDNLLPHISKFDRILRTLINNAILGDVPSIQIILNRVYGKEIDVIKLDKTPDINLADFTDEELILYRKLLDKATDGN